MRDQFPLLATLQQVDDCIRALQDDQSVLPKRLKVHEDACDEAREALAAVNLEIAETDRRRRSLERSLDLGQEQLIKTQGRLREVKTNKEYSAVLAEIDQGKSRIGHLEDQVLELMERAETQRQVFELHEQQVQVAEQELEEQATQIEQTRQDIDNQIGEQGAERQRIVSQLDAGLYATYETLVPQRGGLAVVHLDNGSCGGCHLTIRPQLVSDLRKQETLITCPHCQRMLLWQNQEEFSEVEPEMNPEA